MKRKVITIGSIAALITVLVGGWALADKAADCFYEKVSSVANDEFDKRPEFAVLKRIEEDIQEIRLIFGIMNKDNPEYKKAMEAIEKSKVKK